MKNAQREMPKYDCHKQVWALKIESINYDTESGQNTIIPADDGYAPFEIDTNYLDAHKPQSGGYYVVYKDGYKSYSPAAVFEDGYSLA
ncbi:MAG: hypothetical protein DRR06_14050 [Gammaproteobacteria bacterium]|nr:MAG: hypothetical protein DRR06_14050 [Gammaproteobacteria bacterium]